MPRLRNLAAELLGKKSMVLAALVLADLSEVAALEREASVATRAASHLEDVVTHLGSRTFRGVGAIASAWAALASCSYDKAVVSAQEAIEVLSKTDWRPLEGHAWYVLGSSLSTLDRVRAIEALRESAQIFQTCEAAHRMERALQALRALGGAGRRAAAAVAGPEALTTRERDVIKLAAKGRTAKEIGEELFIGRRTVETHLANAYDKLGVTSKLELVRRASEFAL